MNHLDPTLVPMAFLGLAGFVVAVLVAMVVMGALSRALSADEFVRQITKLIWADNVERAIKLCDAAASRPVGQGLRSRWRRVTLDPCRLRPRTPAYCLESSEGLGNLSQ